MVCDRAWVPVRRAAGQLTKSTMFVRKFPEENSEPRTRPEKSGVATLKAVIGQNGHFVPVQMGYRRTTVVSITQA